MTRFRTTIAFLTLAAASLALGNAHAQFDQNGKLIDPGSYQGSMELQRQSDQQSQHQQTYASPSGQVHYQSGGVSGGSATQAPSLDCYDKLALHADLKPISALVNLGHPILYVNPLYGIERSATTDEQLLLLKWRTARIQCEGVTHKLPVWAQHSAAWKQADLTATAETDQMIGQLALGKLTYGKFNYQRALNSLRATLVH